MRCAICRLNNKAKTKKNAKLRYHRFPVENSYLRDSWLSCCKYVPKDLKNARVCSLHFNEEDYVSTGKFALKYDAVPKEFFVSVSVLFIVYVTMKVITYFVQELECHICERGFADQKKLNIHHKLFHTEVDSKKDVDGTVSEDEVDETQSQGYSLADTEGNQPESTQEDDLMQQEIQDSIEIGLYECRECSATFESFHELEIHGKVHIIILEEDSVE